MNEIDIQFLIKLLNLTTSDNDHEALSAMRKANALLKDHGKTWNNMYHVPIQKPQQNSWTGNMTYEGYTTVDLSELLRRQAEAMGSQQQARQANPNWYQSKETSQQTKEAWKQGK